MKRKSPVTLFKRVRNKSLKMQMEKAIENALANTSSP